MTTLAVTGLLALVFLAWRHAGPLRWPGDGTVARVWRMLSHAGGLGGALVGLWRLGCWPVLTLDAQSTDTTDALAGQALARLPGVRVLVARMEDLPSGLCRWIERMPGRLSLRLRATDAPVTGGDLRGIVTTTDLGEEMPLALEANNAVPSALRALTVAQTYAQRRAWLGICAHAGSPGPLVILSRSNPRQARRWLAQRAHELVRSRRRAWQQPRIWLGLIVVLLALPFYAVTRSDLAALGEAVLSDTPAVWDRAARALQRPTWLQEVRFGGRHATFTQVLQARGRERIWPRIQEHAETRVTEALALPQATLRERATRWRAIRPWARAFGGTPRSAAFAGLYSDRVTALLDPALPFLHAETLARTLARADADYLEALARGASRGPVPPAQAAMDLADVATHRRMRGAGFGHRHAVDMLAAVRTAIQTASALSVALERLAGPLAGRPRELPSALQPLAACLPSLRQAMDTAGDGLRTALRASDAEAAELIIAALPIRACGEFGAALRRAGLRPVHDIRKQASQRRWRAARQAWDTEVVPSLRRVFQRFPFRKVSKEASVRDVALLLGSQSPIRAWIRAHRIRPGRPLRRLLERLNAVENLFSGPHARVDMEVRAAPSPAFSHLFLGSAGGGARYRGGPERWRPWRWESGDTITFTVRGRDHADVHVRTSGPWALLRRLIDGTLSPHGNHWRLTLAAPGGVDAVFHLRFSNLPEGRHPGLLFNPQPRAWKIHGLLAGTELQIP